MDRAELTAALKKLPQDAVYRAKGLIPVTDSGGERQTVLFNYVAGRVTIDPVANYTGAPKMIFMGDEFRRYQNKVGSLLRLPEGSLKLTTRGHAPDGHGHDHGHGAHGHGHGH